MATNPFLQITIDGRSLAGASLATWADGFARQQGNAEWAAGLRDTILELTTGDGTLNAHTSGTTGPPKAVVLNAEDLVASASLTARTFGLRPGDRTLHCLPCEFIAGKMMVVRAMVTGLDLHIVDPRGSVLEHLGVNDRFRFVAMVPQQLHRAIQEDRARVERQFDTVLLGGGPLSHAMIEDLQGLRTRVIHSYGSTETVTHVAIRQLNDNSERSVDHSAIGDVTFTVDQRGCLIVHTPHLRTKEHVTNDLVELIDERHFRWLGRADHVILKGGRKIFPEQLEARTAGVLPYPHFFTAMPDERLGQAVMLVIETELPAGEVLPEVLDKVTSVLKRHEWPRRVTGMRKFDRTASGKVIRATQ